MDKLNLPEFSHQIKKEAGQQWIFDPFRKKFVVLTPEEWVRQHFLNYLVKDLKYPKSLIRVETGLKFNNLGKRTDITVYDRNTKPFLLIECKSAQVGLSNKVFTQLSIYNQTIKAKYLVITNGMKHYCCGMDYDSNSYKFQTHLPAFEESLNY